MPIDIFELILYSKVSFSDVGVTKTLPSRAIQVMVGRGMKEKNQNFKYRSPSSLSLRGEKSSFLKKRR